MPKSSFMAFALVSLAFAGVMLYRNSISDNAAGALSAMIGDPNQMLPPSLTDRWKGYPMRCPETDLPLSLAALDLVARFDEAVAGGLVDRAGRPVEPWPDVLVRIDGKRIYPALIQQTIEAEDGVAWPPRQPANQPMNQQD